MPLPETLSLCIADSDIMRFASGSGVPCFFKHIYTIDHSFLKSKKTEIGKFAILERVMENAGFETVYN